MHRKNWSKWKLSKECGQIILPKFASFVDLSANSRYFLSSTFSPQILCPSLNYSMSMSVAVRELVSDWLVCGYCNTVVVSDWLVCGHCNRELVSDWLACGYCNRALISDWLACGFRHRVLVSDWLARDAGKKRPEPLPAVLNSDWPAVLMPLPLTSVIALSAVSAPMLRSDPGILLETVAGTITMGTQNSS